MVRIAGRSGMSANATRLQGRSRNICSLEGVQANLPRRLLTKGLVRSSLEAGVALALLGFHPAHHPLLPLMDSLPNVSS